jgi:hypothetical protein
MNYKNNSDDEQPELVMTTRDSTPHPDDST